MSQQIAVKARVSNTGPDSQKGFSVGLDWLTISLDVIKSGSEVDDILKALEALAGDQIDFSTTRPRFDNHKHWAGSGRSQRGLLLWFNPPKSAKALLMKTPDGNLMSHPYLLPPPYLDVPDFSAEYIRSQLPSYAELSYDPSPVTVYDPMTGEKRQHHGYSIVVSDEDVIDEPGELRLSMSSKYLDCVAMDALAAYLRTIGDGFGLRCTRFDAALDDHEKRIPLSVVEQAMLDRNYFNARTGGLHLSDDARKKVRGKTIEFGSRQSQTFMRVYDKTVESKGVRIGNRWEAEFKGKKADKCLSEWLAAMADSEQSASGLLVDWVLGAVDFRDRTSGDKNRKRCPVLTWFSEMCEMLAATPVRLRVARPVPTMQRTVDWLKKSVAPSIASASKVLGAKFGWFWKELIEDGERRLTKQRRKIIADTDPMELCY